MFDDPKVSAGIITDAIFTALVRCQIWRESRVEIRKRLHNYLEEMEADTPLDAFDTMLVNVTRVLLLHLEYLGDVSFGRAIPVKVNVSTILKDHALLLRKINHGCIDMTCHLCDNQE